MTKSKHRLTVTVDHELLKAGQLAVKTGQVDSISTWVSIALEDKIRRDRKLGLLKEVVADHEGKFGEIAEAETAAQQSATALDATRSELVGRTGQALIDAEADRTSDRELIAAYKGKPPDAALVQSAIRLAGRTSSAW